jgi:protein-L-isoaspartate(D-aspartate) O-methyltransferase
MIDWRPRAERLAEELSRAGALTDPRWADALRAVPRHVFVPQFHELSSDGGWEVVSASSDPARWAERIYSDRSLVTVLASTPGLLDGHPVPISSSTMPSLMVRMQELLDVKAGMNVVEIGTGTGYNAALLCELLGAERVTTVELHPGVAADARERLSSIGLHPTVVVGDGRAGAPLAAPYDRLIATCGADRVPGTWVSQLTEGGRIVVDLCSESSSGLAVLDKTDPARVSGRFVGRSGHFMWMRPDLDYPFRDPRLAAPVPAGDDRATVRDVTVHPAELDEPGLRTLIGIALPEVQIPSTHVRSLHVGDGSWARLSDDGDTVTEGGPHQLWNRLEHLTDLWRQLGSPETNRYGVDVDTSGRHVFWLDQRSAPLPYEIPPYPTTQ